MDEKVFKVKFCITFLENWRKKGNKFSETFQHMRMRENKNKLMRNAYDAIKISNKIEKYLKINHPYCNKLNAKLKRQLQYQIGVNDDIL